jgi:hypothetical protein
MVPSHSEPQIRGLVLEVATVEDAQSLGPFVHQAEKIAEMMRAAPQKESAGR